MNPGEERLHGGVSGREAAYRAVLAVLRGDAFAAQTLRAMRANAGLAASEAGLATELALGTIRHLLTIEHVLAQVAHFDPRRTPQRLRALLAPAAYQLIWMDRIPVHAAVDEAVKLARKRVRGRAPGMANAVLRSVVRAIETRRSDWQPNDPRRVRVGWADGCLFAQNVLPDPTEVTEHIAAATGERLPRYAALVERLGSIDAEQIAWASQAVPAIVLQRNALRIDAADFARRVESEFQNTAECAGDTAFLPPASHLAHAVLLIEGCAYVQDPTAHAAALLLEPQAGERVLDLCAAPGGKTVALAIAGRGAATIVASDAAPERLELVRQNVSRLGLPNVQVCPPDALAGEFDAALLDVPCSNTGVIARRPEARLGFTQRKLAALVDVQRDLLARAARFVRPGGRLAYSTCSLEPEENGEIVRAFLSAAKGWEIRAELTFLPHWGPRLSDWRDGGYAALLHRD